MNNDVINLVGLVLNIFGSILLAFSLSKYLTSMHGAIAIHDIQLKSIINRDPRVLAADMGNLLKSGINSSRKRTMSGIILIIIGFIIQVIPVVQNITNKK